MQYNICVLFPVMNANLTAAGYGLEGSAVFEIFDLVLEGKTHGFQIISFLSNIPKPTVYARIQGLLLNGVLISKPGMTEKGKPSKKYSSYEINFPELFLFFLEWLDKQNYFKVDTNSLRNDKKFFENFKVFFVKKDYKAASTFHDAFNVFCVLNF